MSNAERIKALRLCADEEEDCDGCAYYTQGCMLKMMRDAADALEVAEAYEEAWSKKCERLEKRIAELMPKEGEWIVTTEVSDDGAVTSHINCSRCGFYWREPKHGKAFKRCPNCGARMDGKEKDDE